MWLRNRRGVFPSFAKEGWTRPKKVLRSLLCGADGVVVSSYRLFIPNDFDKRWLETTTPSAPTTERDHFFMAQPPLLREGGDFASPIRIRNFGQLCLFHEGNLL